MAKIRPAEPMRKLYYEGRAAYMNHLTSESCPFKVSLHHRTYWLAGWNDADIERQNELRSVIKSELLSRENRISGEQE